MQFTVKTVLQPFNFQMLPEITIIHCFIAMYCENATKIFNFQMLPEITIIHCYLQSKRYEKQLAFKYCQKLQ